MFMLDDMDIDTRRRYISNCELGNCLPASAMALADEVQAAPQAAVVDSNLLAFTPGTSREVIEAVTDCQLFATLVANKAFDPETANTQWFDKYSEVLSHLGWAPSALNYYEASDGGQQFSMDRIVLDMLKTALLATTLPGPTSAVLIGTATRMIDTLRTSDKPLRLFESRSHSEGGANFRVGTCHEAQDGTVNVALGTVNFRSSNKRTNVLFTTWNSGEAHVYAASYNVLFNRRHFETVQEEVRRKLTSEARKHIELFDI